MSPGIDLCRRVGKRSVGPGEEVVATRSKVESGKGPSRRPSEGEGVPTTTGETRRSGREKRLEIWILGFHDLYRCTYRVVVEARRRPRCVQRLSKVVEGRDRKGPRGLRCDLWTRSRLTGGGEKRRGRDHRDGVGTGRRKEGEGGEEIIGVAEVRHSTDGGTVGTSPTTT